MGLMSSMFGVVLTVVIAGLFACPLIVSTTLLRR
jgi:hypothetical protein